MTHLPIKPSDTTVRQGGKDAVVPGSVAETIPTMVEHPDLVTMRGNLPTLVSQPSNPALAFSQVKSEPAPSPVVTPAIISFAQKPIYPYGLEPTHYPRAPIKRRRRRIVPHGST